MPDNYNFINHLCYILEYIILLQDFINSEMKEQVKTLKTGRLGGFKWFAEDLCSSLCFSIYQKVSFSLLQQSIWMFFYSPHHKSIKLFLCFSEGILRSVMLNDYTEKYRIWIIVTVIGVSSFVKKQEFKTFHKDHQPLD